MRYGGIHIIMTSLYLFENLKWGKYSLLVEDSEILLNENKFITYLDYENENKVIYTNFFFPEINHVLKIPIFSIGEILPSITFKFEIFNLLKYECLAFYKTINESHQD